MTGIYEKRQLSPKEQQEEERQKKEDMLRRVVAHAPTLKFLNQVIYDICMIEETHSSTDTNQLCHNNGKREIGYKILKELREVEPEIETKLRRS